MKRAALTVCLLMLLQPETQVFFDTAPGGYGPHGYDYVGRPDGTLRTTVACEPGPGGWGDTVIGHVEFYVDGALCEGASCNVPCEVYVNFDADCDGDVDLQDFAEFQRAFGP
jgi:hypothetical protein